VNHSSRRPDFACYAWAKHGWFLFALFSVSAVGDRRRVGVMRYNSGTRALAEEYAKAIIKHTTVSDPKVDLCVIRDEARTVVSEVRRTPGGAEAKSDRRL
jgi:hypothetical protein